MREGAQLFIGDSVDDLDTAEQNSVVFIDDAGTTKRYAYNSTAEEWQTDEPTIPDGSVTYSQLQEVSATDKLLGRASSGAGVVEEIDCTAAGRALLDDADAAAQRTTLGLGTAATTSSGAYDAAGAAAAAQSASQPLDSDLTTIAALTPSNDDIVQRKAGAWANRSIAQLKTDLSLSGTNTGDQSAVSGNAGTATALATPRAINGVSFDGTAAISVPAGIFVTGITTGLAAAADLFYTPNTTFGGSGTLIQRQIAVSAGTLKNLRVHTGAAQSGTGSLVVKVWVNGSAVLTATVTAGGAAGVYDSGATTVSVSDNDLISVEIINNASVTSAANVMISFYLR